MFSSATLEPAQKKKATKLSAEPSRMGSPAPSSSTGAGTCPCGGGCPRCQRESGFIGGNAGADLADETILGAASSIGENTFNGPTWGNAGQFQWDIDWKTDGTSGFIVQHIEVKIHGSKSDGTAIDNASSHLTPSYFEVWEVDSAGKVTGNGGRLSGKDFWHLPDRSPLGSVFTLSAKGTAFWTDQDPAAAGYTSGKVKNSGQLLSDTAAPPGIGSPLLVREAFGSWSMDGAEMLPGCFTNEK